jgi:DNA-binding response OmpR family regulator
VSTLILLVEDDEALAHLVSNFLSNHGFKVIIERSGVNATRMIKDLQPDLVILDLNLPGKNGFQICEEARTSYQGPILMLTAKDTNSDQIKGLELGADDYVIKPAEPQVLLARIRVLLRRHQTDISEVETLRFGGLYIDATSRRVLLDDADVPLSTHEYGLLLELASHAGKPLSREHLFTTVYDRPYNGLDRTIDVRISQLRKKLGDDGNPPNRIKTVWGLGYLFVEKAW